MRITSAVGDLKKTKKKKYCECVCVGGGGGGGGVGWVREEGGLKSLIGIVVGEYQLFGVWWLKSSPDV